MLEKLSPIRAAIDAAITPLVDAVFAQRIIDESELRGVECFASFSMAKSAQQSDDAQDDWRISLNMSVCIAAPATDDELEVLAISIKQAIETDATLFGLVSGIVFDGHEYPDEQGDKYAELTMQFEIILT